ncbi:MAG TPA: CRISPR-associated endonuclease Cas3'', partial [Longimicrobiales bacterium]|nr:CRISPR-associated endonuclease Cas3'' [Longimicrobiales bacterium]
FTGLPMMLADHLDGVASLAADFASRAHLPRGIKATLLWAGRLHDLGKADPRFQLMLHGGDEISARFGGVLAKSRVPWQDVAARRAGRIRAGYPQGQRHELVSLNMIENASGLRDRVEADGADWELLLHLVATHHGWCRPLAPVVKDETGEPVAWSSGESEFRGRTDHGFDALDSGLADRFWRLNTQYGWHELAYLEAMLRLADHRNSGGETA